VIPRPTNTLGVTCCLPGVRVKNKLDKETDMRTEAIESVVASLLVAQEESINPEMWYVIQDVQSKKLAICVLETVHEMRDFARVWSGTDFGLRSVSDLERLKLIGGPGEAPVLVAFTSEGLIHKLLDIPEESGALMVMVADYMAHPVLVSGFKRFRSRQLKG
jgi:hypothetical protein